MSRYRSELENLRDHIKTLRVASLVLVVLLIGSLVAWDRARQDLRVIVPPDLRSGASLDANEVTETSVYAFGYYIFQQLNRWPHNGEKEYPEAIYRLKHYMTPEFEGEVLADLKYKGKGGELTSRTRAVQEVPGSGYAEHRVETLGNGVWVVHLDLQIIESVQGMRVKDTQVRYPLRVVRYPVDPERNPWGLALDGFTGNPERLATEVIEVPGAPPDRWSAPLKPPEPGAVKTP